MQWLSEATRPVAVFDFDHTRIDADGAGFFLTTPINRSTISLAGERGWLNGNGHYREPTTMQR